MSYLLFCTWGVRHNALLKLEFDVMSIVKLTHP
jgi:hypothetical protein